MRSLIVFLGLCIFISSCKVAALKPDLYLERPAPHVELDNGKVIEAKTVSFNKTFLGPTEIIADKTIFGADSVAFYSTGMDYFVNVGTTYFPSKIINGKINVFRSSNSFQQTNYSPASFGGGSSYSYSQQTANKFYIQAAGTKPVYKFSYEHLARMIPKTSPSYHLLNSYKRTRWLARGGFVLTGVCIASGAILMANGSRGLRVISGGVALGAVSFSIGYSNYSKLTNALVEYNKEADTAK